MVLVMMLGHCALAGITVALSTFWHSQFIPLLSDDSPSLRLALHAHPTSVAFTTAQISAGIILSRVIPTAFHPCPLSEIPLPRLAFATALQSIGVTVANACTIPHLSPFVKPQLSHRTSSYVCAIIIIVSVVTATLSSSGEMFSSEGIATITKVTFPGGLTWVLPLSNAIVPSLRHLIVLSMTFGVTVVVPPVLIKWSVSPTPAVIIESASYVLGLTIALGFLGGQLLNPATVLSALDMQSATWNPLLWVTVVIALMTMELLMSIFKSPSGIQCPPVDLDKLGRDGGCAALPPYAPPCVRACFGAALFAAGLGLSGVSPVAALVYFGASPSNPACLVVMGTIVICTAIASLILDVVDEQMTEMELFNTT